MSSVVNYAYVPGSHLMAGWSNDFAAVSRTYEPHRDLLTQVRNVAGVSTNLFAYDALTLALTNETIIAHGETNVLSRTPDSLGRPSGISLGSPYVVAYGYDGYGRFAAVSSSVYSVSSVVNYSYLPGSHLISGYTAGDFTRSVHYEPHRDLIAAVSNTWDSALVSAFDYTNDALGRRTARADSGSAFGVAITNAFGYNIRSEVESALMGTNQYGYAFDPIGNREWASLNAATNLYAANALNQYTNVLCASAPPREDIPTYDEDGNILRLRDWTLEWDGENRLVLASNATVTVRYAHDFMGRRIWRSSEGVTNHFDYDGWALIRETIIDQQSTITNHFVYGPDLSRSLQGAGTIGGILSANFNGEPVFYAYDGNGNVTDLVDTNGAIRAHYEYDAFGNVTVQSGDLAAANPFRFSTKRQDEATGLLYYGYRDLDTVWGRWLSRDPIGELGGLNLLMFTMNDPINGFDPLGLRQRGHHIVPESIWRCVFGERRMNIWNEALDTADAVINTVDHDYTGHGEYNRRIQERIEEYLRHNRIRPCCVTKQQAGEILNLVRNSSDSYISGFNNALRTGGPEGLETWLNAGARELAQAEREAVRQARRLGGHADDLAARTRYVTRAGRVVRVILIGTFVYTATQEGVQAATEETVRDLIFADEILWGMERVNDWFERRFEPLTLESRCRRAGLDDCDIP